MPAKVVVEAFPVMLQFLITLLVEPLVLLKLATQITQDEVPVLVLVKVKFLLVPPELDPSIVI
jgi:hypothetical protein